MEYARTRLLKLKTCRMVISALVPLHQFGETDFTCETVVSMPCLLVILVFCNTWSCKLFSPSASGGCSIHHRPNYTCNQSPAIYCNSSFNKSEQTGLSSAKSQHISDLNTSRSHELVEIPRSRIDAAELEERRGLCSPHASFPAIEGPEAAQISQRARMHFEMTRPTTTAAELATGDDEVHRTQVDSK